MALALVCAIGLGRTGRAEEVFVVRVSAGEATIKGGTETLATVPQGTRLWVFSVRHGGAWLEVKVPKNEQHGWIAASQVERSSPAASTRLTSAYARYKRAQGLKEHGKFDEASSEMTAALEVIREAHGADDPMVAAIVEDLGHVSLMRVKWDEAIKYYTEAVAIFRKMLGAYHVHTARSLNGLGLAAQNVGWREAEANVLAQKSFEEALKIRIDVQARPDERVAVEMKSELANVDAASG
jgi:hypothetical protein